MEELLKTIQEKHGLTEKEAKAVLITISNYIKEKFPMVKGAVDNLFQFKGNEADSDSNSSDNQDYMRKNITESDDFLDI